MADEAQEATVPAVETTPPAVETAAPEPQVTAEPTKPQEPLTKHEARQHALTRMREKLTAKATSEPAQTATEKPVAEEPATEPAEEPTTETPEPVAEPSKKLVEQEPAPEPEVDKPKYVIDIDPNHPVASTVKGPLLVNDENTAKAVKALLNGTYVRRNQVSEANRRAEEAEEKFLKLQTRIDAEKEWRGSESYQQKVDKYNRMLALEDQGDLDKGTALEYWNSVQPEVDKKANEKFAAKQTELRQAAAQRAEAEWTDESWVRAQKNIPQAVAALPGFKQYFDDAVGLFSIAFQRGQFRHLRAGDAEGLHREFSTFLNKELVARPEVGTALRQAKQSQQDRERQSADNAAAAERERARIAKQAVEDHMKKLAEGKRENPPNPIASLTPASAGRANTPSSNGDEDLANLSPFEARKRAAARVREKARAYRR